MVIHGEDSLNEGTENVLRLGDGVSEEKTPEAAEVAPVEQLEEPVYCQETPPKSKKDFIKWKFLHGITLDDMVDDGENPSSLRVYAAELIKEGYLEETPRRQPVEYKPQSPKALPPGTKEVVRRPAATPKIFSRGAPPEVILSGMHIPDGIPGLEKFEMGIQFGASMVMMGVRIAQELSTIGVQQARPLLDMARDMRAGEAAAAGHAASEAAEEAAGRVAEQFAPYLEQLKEKPTSSSGDPFKDMMAEIMKPLLKGMIAKLMPAGTTDTGSDLPSGWTKE